MRCITLATSSAPTSGLGDWGTGRSRFVSCAITAILGQAAIALISPFLGLLTPVLRTNKRRDRPSAHCWKKAIAHSFITYRTSQPMINIISPSPNLPVSQSPHPLTLPLS
ncbi:MAG: hypothetical protein AAGD25_09225 [Cyanobacteria bacterium P01_F01_bin.150]